MLGKRLYQCVCAMLFLSLPMFSQSVSGQKWLLMSIDQLERGIKKDIGSYLRVELWFEGDTVYKGNFCNNYNGRFKSKEDFTCMLSAPEHGKRQCMGFSDEEYELFRLYPLVYKYKLKGDLLYLFTNDQRRLVFKKEHTN